MTFQKMEKGSFFCDKTSQSNVNNFFLLEVGSSKIAVFKVLIMALKI